MRLHAISLSLLALIGAPTFADEGMWTFDNLPYEQLKACYNFVTTNDIIGGNSGSPVINAKGEIVGLAFDGNVHSHGGGFWMDSKLNRTVGVTSGGIQEALKSIYDATELLNEIAGH